MEKFQETFNQINGDIIPQLKEILLRNSVLIGIILFLLIFIYIGYRRGFFDRVLSLGAVVITLIAEIKVFPFVVQFVQENETVHQIFLNIVMNFMHVDAENAKSPLYAILGLNVLADNAADKMGELAAKMICFILIFIAVRLLLRFAALIFRGLKKIYLIDSVDKLFGMVFGFAEGMILIWIFMLVVSGLPNVPVCAYILDQIMESPILMQIYNQNFLLLFIVDILK